MTGQYSIYGCEKALLNRPDKSHAYLALVSEENGQHRVIQELEFDSNEFAGKEYLVHSATVCGDEYIKDNDITNKFNRYATGDRQHIFEKWREGLAMAERIERRRFIFQPGSDPTAINCRAGAIAVLNAMGFEFVVVNHAERSQSGTKADLFSRLLTQSAPAQNSQAPQAPEISAP